MKIECRLENMSYNFAQKGTKFEFFSYGNILPNLESFLGKKVNLELKGNQRSLSANRLLVEIDR